MLLYFVAKQTRLSTNTKKTYYFIMWVFIVVLNTETRRVPCDRHEVYLLLESFKLHLFKATEIQDVRCLDIKRTPKKLEEVNLRWSVDKCRKFSSSVFLVYLIFHFISLYSSPLSGIHLGSYVKPIRSSDRSFKCLAVG